MHRQSEKKLVKQQYLLYMSPQYGELRPTSFKIFLVFYFNTEPRLNSPQTPVRAVQISVRVTAYIDRDVDASC